MATSSPRLETPTFLRIDLTAVHVHLDPFQVLARGGRAPGPFDLGWKDTVDLRPAEHVDVAVRFDDHAGRFLLHCHNLEHEDRMMMAAFATA